MGAQLGGEAAFTDINMTPLIDIVLVVLIIMMVNIPIEVEELGVRLPNLVDEPPPLPPDTPPPEQLMVAVYENGDIALNRIVMTEPKLREQLSRRLRTLEKKQVFVDAHPDVPLADVVDMVDVARESGAEKVGFAKVKPEGPLSPVGVSSGAMPRDVIAGNPTIAERLDEKVLDNVIVDGPLQAILPGIKACYFAALAVDPALTGDYFLEITVGPDGQQMEEPKLLKDSVDDPAMKACVMKLLPQLSYPPIGEQNTAVVRYPLLFSPG